MIKKADIILFIGLLLISMSLLFYFILLPKQSGNTLVITQNGNEIERISLSEDKTIVIGENKVIIKDSKAYMEYAVCPDKVCVNQGQISKVGEVIVCLPQKIILEVK